jgi:hypothetical protein
MITLFFIIIIKFDNIKNYSILFFLIYTKKEFYKL